jgi:hypothetical protein
MNTRLSKTMMILAIVSLLSAGSALAQRQNRERDWQKGPPTVEERLARMSAALNLNSEQSMQLHAKLQEQAENKAYLHEQVMEFLGPEICAQRAEHEQAILAILSDEQAALFLEIKQQRQERKANNTNNRKGGGGNGMGKLDCPN